MDQKTPRQCNVKRLRRETCSTPLGLAKCQKRNPPFPTFARLSSHQNIDTGPFACPLRNLKNYCRSNGRMSKQSLIERSGQTPNYQPDWRSVCVFGFGWDHQLAYTKHRYPCETFSFHCEQLRLYKSFKWRLTFFLPGCHFNSYSTADTSLLVSVSSAQKKTCEDNLPNSMTMSTVPEHCVLTCCSGHFLSTKILQLVIKRTVITLPGRSASWVIQYHSLCISDTSKHINSQSQPPTKWPLIWFFFGKLKWRGEGSRASQINCPRGKVFMLGRF